MTNPTNNGRIEQKFAALKAAHKKALVAYIAAGDPDLETSAELLAGLPAAGVDVIELSVPFSDPVADGPTIQQANIRAFKAGITLKKVLAMVADFRRADTTTPIVLMGYYNPLYAYGVDAFLRDAKAAGVDGLIVVDLPPEEDAELRTPAEAAGIDIVRLLTPTTDAARLRTLLKSASGFLYYVSIAGITGTQAANVAPVHRAVAEAKQHTQLPIVIGFGISTPAQAAEMVKGSDGVVVGSAIVNKIVENLDTAGRAKAALVKNVLDFILSLSKAIQPPFA